MHTIYRQAYTPTHILKNIQINTHTKKNVHTEAERDRQSREREKYVANWLPMLKVVGIVSIDSDFSIKRSIVERDKRRNLKIAFICISQW